MSQYVSSTRSVQAYLIQKLWAHPFAPDMVVLECNGIPPVLIARDTPLTCCEMHVPMPGCWLVFDDINGVDIFNSEQFEELFELEDRGDELAPEQLDLFEDDNGGNLH